MYAQIFMYGAYEPDASRVVADLLREGDFTVDIGANHGWYTVLMGARVGPRGQVWAVEPTPPLLAALEANVRINPTLPVAVQPIALGITGGSAELHLFRGLPHGHASGSTLGRNDYSTYRVPRRRLDDLLAEAATAAPTFVKLDVEGGELEVLRGAERLAGSDHAPIWMLEVNFETSAAFGYKPRDLISYLREAGPYSAYRVAPQGLQIEVDPDSAPHGTTWICVPPAFGDRVKAQL
jgi:FkbM family methyltransferase